ncbi:secreted protein [Candidatus Thiomargarita nelsonii]|uniref:Secreted protein n=1 Tax=Candidatus Thiomargarita nelsonii TaxID=1003181 RepID=A0A176RWM7_9GAMM|nr:secreted protein [Candidatus Thiomargarita nelsonii]
MPRISLILVCSCCTACTSWLVSATSKPLGKPNNSNRAFKAGRLKSLGRSKCRNVNNSLIGSAAKFAKFVAS